MKIEQLYTGCLAEAAYYIESNGEAAIIDPLRETEPYLKKLKAAGVELKYVLETHFHADFVSGHVDLAKATGATIVYGPKAEPSYAAHIATDGEKLQIGALTLEVLHTPGHTPESTTYLLRDENHSPCCIFTGDTLFIGDVGRPDLAVKSDLSQADLASMLYDSLRNKIMTLPDEVVVYPAHGAGSACGKNMSKETFDTLGNQKQKNYALRQDMSREEFIKEVTEGLLPPPQYFPKNALMNKLGYAPVEEVINQGLTPLSPAAFEAAVEAHGALVLDTRKETTFVKGYIPGSIFIGIDGQFAPWVGTLITDLKHPIAIVAEPGREKEVVTRLSRVGYDHTIGYLEGGFDAWVAAGKPVETIESITAAQLEERMSTGTLQLVDVRKPGEYEAEHVENVRHAPLDFLNDHLAELSKEDTLHLHCAGGYRSVIAISILKSRGWDKLVNVEGGFNAIKQTDITRTNYVCPTTLK